MKKYQVVERYFEESRIVVTLGDRVSANVIAIGLQKAYKKLGLSHWFLVREVKENE